MKERVWVTVPASKRIKDRRAVAVEFAMSKARELQKKWGVESVRVTELHPETAAVITSDWMKVECREFEIVGGDDAT